MPILAAIAVPHPPLAIPEIGSGLERGIQKTIDSFMEAAEFIAKQKPETVIIISPHAELLYDRFHISAGKEAEGSFVDYGYPNIKLSTKYDSELSLKIASVAKKNNIETNLSVGRNSALDHGTMIPLYFLQKIMSDFEIVRIGLSCLSLEEHFDFGRSIAQAVGDKPVAIVGSGDLSHRLKDEGPYGFAPEGPVLDNQIVSAFADGDLKKLLEIDPILAEKGGECGLRAFSIMAGALDHLYIQSDLLSYEGPYGVGYSVATFLPGRKKASESELNDKQNPDAAEDSLTEGNNDTEDEWVSLARETVESFVTDRRIPSVPSELTAELSENQAGVFVSIHRMGELRGCIGTISPTTRCVAEEIIQNAISAASRDPRFAPISKDELPFLEIKVDVLGEAEEIQSIDDLDVKRYGVIVSNKGRKGLLLPDLEGVDTVEYQVSIARQKAGISQNEPLKIERFEVIRHE